MFARARDTFENEINIVKFLRKIRRFEANFKVINAKIDFNQAEKHEFLTIDSSSEETRE